MKEPAADWHLDRRLQITHILSTMAMVVGATLYLGDIRKDVELLKAEKVTQAQRDAKQDAEQGDAKRDTNERLHRIDDKLDKLIEYMRPMRRIP